jgi:Uma2 family endonuclease
VATNVDPTNTIPVSLTAHVANGAHAEFDPMPIIADDMPVIYEDDGQDEMGESTPHTIAERVLTLAIESHLWSRTECRVFSNLDIFYHRTDPRAYVSPDLMVVTPFQQLPSDIASYHIGTQGPAPILRLEILSRRSFQQQDLTNKPIIYSQLGVPEYILVDTTGKFLEQRLLLRRLENDGSWKDEQDSDGGVTSRLGFRIIMEDDGKLRVVDCATGKHYVRPEEAQESLDHARAEVRAARELAAAESEERRRAEERAKSAEAELARLRGTPPA